MLDLNRVLLLDDSKLMRELLKALLRPHCREVHVAGSLAEAREVLAHHDGIELALVDSILPDGSGLGLLEDLAARGDEKPHTIVITARWQESEARVARELGALAYLGKPVSIRDITRAWQEHGPPGRVLQPRSPRRLLAKARLGNPQRPQEHLLEWNVHDLSVGGAFLETHGPLPVGLRLDLELVLGEHSVRTPASVMRVQEPGWMNPSGVGVRFDALDPMASVIIEAFVGTCNDLLD